MPEDIVFDNRSQARDASDNGGVQIESVCGKFLRRVTKIRRNFVPSRENAISLYKRKNWFGSRLGDMRHTYPFERFFLSDMS